MERLRVASQPYSIISEDASDAGDEERTALYRPKHKHGENPSLNGRRPRHLFHRMKLWQLFVELILAVCSICFLVYAVLAYTHNGRPARESISSAVLDASQYAPTVFPILFAAIVGRCLKSIAAIKMERGSRVLTLEYLLGSRTVFNTVTTLVELRSIHILVPGLLLLWSLSPLGGQASLRIVSVTDGYMTSQTNLTYLAFLSDYSTYLPRSSTSELLAPINSLFTSALSSPENAKRAPQDQYGNIKIPLYETPNAEVIAYKTDAAWRAVSTEGSSGEHWSSLQGLPVHGLSLNLSNNFTMNTGYMTAHCKLSGQEVPNEGNADTTPYALFGNNSGWSGANYMMESDYPYLEGSTLLFGVAKPARIIFKSLAVWDSEETNPLTIANCSITMNYIEANISCNGRDCQSVAIRPSTNPVNHTQFLSSNLALNSTYYTPLNGLAQRSTHFQAFLQNFINATNPNLACTDTHCPTSAIENYLDQPLTSSANAGQGESSSSPVLWRIGDQDFSLRFTQLINTYWIASIAPFAVFGELNTTTINDTFVQNPSRKNTQGDLSAAGYYLDTTISETTSLESVMKCDMHWFAVLILSSFVMLFATCITATLNILKKAPEIFDSFSSLLRYNVYAAIPHQPSLDDSVAVARRLKDTRVLFGDVGPDQDVSYAGLAVIGEGGDVVKRLDRRRVYV